MLYEKWFVKCSTFESFCLAASAIAAEFHSNNTYSYYFQETKVGSPEKNQQNTSCIIPEQFFTMEERQS